MAPLAALLAIAASLPLRAAAPAPLFGEYRLDGAHGGSAAAVAGPGAARAPTELLARAAGAGGGPYLQPAVAGGAGAAVLVDAKGVVTCALPGAAAPLWSYASQLTPAPSLAASTPAISPDGSVVVVLIATWAIALDMATGAALWARNVNRTLTFPPAFLADGSGVVCTTQASFVYIFDPASGGTATIPSVAAGPAATLADPTDGSCVVFVEDGTGYLRRYCAGTSPPWQMPTWTFTAAPEASLLAPVIAGGVVYMVTGVSGDVYAVDAYSGAQVCSSADDTAPVTQPPVFIGGAYGIAFAVPSVGIVYVTGPGAGACAGVAVVEFAPGTFTPLVLDSARVAYFGLTLAANGAQFAGAIDFSGSGKPPVLWNASLGGVTATALSPPALGADGALLFTRLAVADGSSLELLALYSPVPPSVCPPGEVSLRNGTCAPCSAGTFSGPVNASAPATACKPCPAGSSSPTNSSLASACKACAAGTFSPGGGGACQPCAAGAYGPAANATSCTLCPAGTASAALPGANSSAVCVACLPGSAQPASGATACPPCAAGTYSLAARATACIAAAPACYTAPGSSVACGAAMPYAMFGVDATHGGQSALAGPGAAPSFVKLIIFSGQSSLPLSGLALGPTGGVVGGTAYSGLVFLGLTDDIFAVSSANGAIVNNYNAPPLSSFAGSPAVAPWGTVYVLSSLLQLVALRFDGAGDPLFVTASPAATKGYAVVPPTVHSANRAVYISAGSSGIVAVNGDTGAALWSWIPDTDPITLGPYACRAAVALDAAGTRVFVGCDDFAVHALNASSGALLWSHPLSAAVRAAPAVSADGAIVFASSDANNLVALNASSGEPVWLPVAVSPSAVRAAPVVAAGVGVVVATRGGVVFAANGDAAGAVVWQTAIAPNASSITLGANNTLFVTCEDGSLYSLRTSDGVVQWRLSLGEPLYAPPVLLASGGAGGALLLPSLRTSALFLVTGLSASATPTSSATASGTASSTATASATATRTGTGTSSNSPTASTTSTSSRSSSNSLSSSVTPSTSGTPSASASTNSTAANGGGNAAAEGLSSAGAIALSAAVPLIIVAGLVGAALRMGRVRFVGPGGDGVAVVRDWRGGSGYGAIGGAGGAAAQPPAVAVR